MCYKINEEAKRIMRFTENNTKADKALKDHGNHVYMMRKEDLENENDNPFIVSPDGPNHPNFSLFLTEGNLVYVGRIDPPHQ
jgi:hypothetical protein